MTTQTVEGGQNPYVGPRPFQSADSGRFFGREREARDLISLVVSERLVLFYAQSGAGKSSLLNARLSPGLQKRGFVTLPVGRVSGRATAVDEPENIFVFNLLASLDEGKTDPQHLAHLSLGDYLAELAFDEGSGADGGSEPSQAAFQPLALIIDQFEELFTNHLDSWNYRENFFQQLAQALEADPYLWIILVMREDYVAEMDPYAYLLPGRLRARYYMQRMEYRAALEAVKSPVKALRPFDDGVAEELVNNLRLVAAGEGPDGSPRYLEGQFIEPVQLQVVCYQLWEQLKADQNHPRITHEDLERLSRGKDLAQFISRALADFYEQSIAGVLQALQDTTLSRTGQVSERNLREWFSTQLVTEAGTRGFVFQGDEKTGGLPNAAVRLLEQQFIIRSETRAAGKWYELVHDRFVAPILQANQEWRERTSSPLTLDSDLWLSEGRSAARLYQGNQLNAALEWLEKHANEASELEREFIMASRDAEIRQRTRRQRILIGIFSVLLVMLSALTVYSWYQSQMALMNAEEAKRQQSTAEFLQGLADQQSITAVAARARAETASTLAVEESQRADQQRAAAEAASALAVEERLRADQQRATAEAASTLAVEESQRADQQRATAVAALIQAEQDRDLAQTAEKQALASRLSSLSIYFRESNLDLSLLLSMYALEVSHNWEGLRALLDGVQRGLANRIEKIGASNYQETAAYSLALSPDGAWMVTSSLKKVYAWAVEPGVQLPKIPPEFVGEVIINTVAFDSTGAILARGGGDGLVKFLNLQSGQVTVYKPFGYSYAGISRIAFQPSGDLIAVATQKEASSNQGWVFVYNYVTSQVEDTRDCGPYDCSALGWSPDGKKLAIGSENGSIQIIDVNQKTIMMSQSRAHQGKVTSLVWYPDGQRMVSGGLGNFLIQWDTSKWNVLQESSPVDTPLIFNLAISPDGRFLLGGTSEEGVWVAMWNAETLARVRPYKFREHVRTVAGVAFNPQGNRFVTAGYDGWVLLWRFEPVEPLASPLLSLKGGRFTGIFQQTDGSLLFSQTTSGGVLEVMREDEKPFFTYPIPHSVMTPLQLDGQPAIAAGGFDGMVRFFNALTGEAILKPAPFKAGPGQVRSLAASQDGKTLAVAVCRASQRCDQLALFDLASGQPVEPKPDLTPLNLTTITSLAFNPDGDQLAIGSGSGSIGIYNLSTGEIALVVTEGLNLQNVTLSVTGIAFSANEQGILAAGFNDGRIALWEARSRGPIGEFAERMNGEVTALSFRKGEDGYWKMLAMTYRGEVREWEVDEAMWIQRACRIAKRNLTDVEKAKFLPTISEPGDVCPVE